MSFLIFVQFSMSEILFFLKLENEVSHSIFDSGSFSNLQAALSGKRQSFLNSPSPAPEFYSLQISHRLSVLLLSQHSGKFREIHLNEVDSSFESFIFASPRPFKLRNIYVFGNVSYQTTFTIFLLKKFF